MIIINTKFQEKLTSKALNDKIDLIVGSNARMFGFEATKASDTSISLPPGRCVITGVFIEEDAVTRIIEIDPSMLSFGKLYVQMTYTHTEKRVEFTISNAELTDKTSLTIATINMVDMKISSIDVTKALLSLKDMSIYIDEVIEENIALAEEHAKQYTDNQVQLVAETGIPKLVTYKYGITALTDGQVKFDIPNEYFDPTTDSIELIRNGVDITCFTEQYTITPPVTTDGVVTKGFVTLAEGVSMGSKIGIKLLKNVPIGTEGAINGGVLGVNSVPSNRIIGLDTFEEEVTTQLSDLTKIAGTVDDTGSANTYVITLASAPTAYAKYQTFKFIAKTSNTGASTFNVNGLGIKSLVKDVNVALVTGDILAGQMITAIYDGANFQIVPDFSTQLGLKANQSSLTTHLADLTTDSDGAHGFKVEKGTWTPVLKVGSNTTNYTYSSQGGRYIKENNKVTVWFEIAISTKGSNTGQIIITGLPYAVAEITAGNSVGISNLVYPTGVSSVSVKAGDSNIYLYGNGSNYNAVATDTYVTTSGYLCGQISYITY